MQDALFPPLTPVQPQVKLVAPDATVLAAPLAHRLALGAATDAALLAVPHEALTAALKLVLTTVQSALIAPVV